MDCDGKKERRRVSSPSPRLRGEGRGEGAFPQAQTRGGAPLPNPPPQAAERSASGFYLLYLAWLALLAIALASPAFAEKGKLRERLTPDVMAVVYPGAERLGPEEGSPPAIAVYRGDKAVAYIFSTLDIIAAPGYSVTPFDIIAGVHVEGRITRAQVVVHPGPHLDPHPVR